MASEHFYNKCYHNILPSAKMTEIDLEPTVTVSGKALTILEQKYRIEKTKKPNLSFAAFISEAALMELERRNILQAQSISDKYDSNLCNKARYNRWLVW
jgi:hypothetical protein